MSRKTRSTTPRNPDTRSPPILERPPTKPWPRPPRLVRERALAQDSLTTLGLRNIHWLRDTTSSLVLRVPCTYVEEYSQHSLKPPSRTRATPGVSRLLTGSQDMLTLLNTRRETRPLRLVPLTPNVMEYLTPRRENTDSTLDPPPCLLERAPDLGQGRNIQDLRWTCLGSLQGLY